MAAICLVLVVSGCAEHDGEQSGPASGAVADIVSALAPCEGAPYVAVYTGQTAEPDPTGKYGSEFYGITADGQVKQITAGRDGTAADISADGTELYSLRYAGPLGDPSPQSVAADTVLDTTDTATGTTTHTVPAPDAEDVDVTADGASVLVEASLAPGFTIHPRASTSIDSSTAVENKTPAVDEIIDWPVWNPTGTAFAFISVPRDVWAGGPAQVRLRDVASGNETVVYETQFHEKYPVSLRFSPDGSRLLATEMPAKTPIEYWGIEIDLAAKSVVSETPMVEHLAYTSNDTVLGMDGRNLRLYEYGPNGLELTTTAEVPTSGWSPLIPECALGPK